jgi:hypothetical protein
MSGHRLRSGYGELSPNRKRFLVRLAITVPLVLVLTWIGLTCQDCQFPPRY